MYFPKPYENPAYHVSALDDNSDYPALTARQPQIPTASSCYNVEDTMVLSALPREVLQHCLSFVDPTDLINVAQTSRDLHLYVSSNKHVLSKTLFLQLLDSPKRDANGLDPNWEYEDAKQKKRGKSKDVKPVPWDEEKKPDIQQSFAPVFDAKKVDWDSEIKRLSKFLTIMRSDNVQEKKDQIAFVVQTITKYLRAASSGEKSQTAAFLKNVFGDASNFDIFLCNSTLFSRLKGEHSQFPLPSREQKLLDTSRNFSAKLHCLYGVPIESIGRTRGKSSYPFACSKVYDIRNYSHSSKWGPFLHDGSGNVDWEMVEAIMVIIGHNVRKFGHIRSPGPSKNLWRRPWSEAVPYSYVQKHSADFNKTSNGRTAKEKALIAGDPYGVSGTWKRVVCFLDYTEFHQYNFAQNPPPFGTPRQGLQTVEATRYILMELKITKIEKPGPEDGPLPVVYFTGTSRSMHESWDANANSNLRGTVRMTPEGEIRWTSISVYFGEERWRSEGVQVGGIRSGRGVLGNWFDKDYDPHGPVGPSAFWKISDEWLHGIVNTGGWGEAPPDFAVDDDNDDDNDDNEDDNDVGSDESEENKYEDEGEDEEGEETLDGDDNDAVVHEVAQHILAAMHGGHLWHILGGSNLPDD